MESPLASAKFRSSSAHIVFSPFSPDLDIPCCPTKFYVWKNVISLRLFSAESFPGKFVFRINASPNLLNTVPSKILPHGGGDMRDGSGKKRNETEHQWYLIREARLPPKSCFWLAYLVSFLFLSFNHSPSGRRLSLILCSPKHAINNKNTCFAVVS